MRKRRQKIVDPKKLKKHSKIVQERSNPFRIVGNRQETNTGIISTDYSGENFEVITEVIVPGSATEVVMSPDKVKVFRVVQGVGTLLLDPDYRESKGVNLISKKISQGDVIELRANTPYRFNTPTDLNLVLVVTQDAGYNNNLKIIDANFTVSDVPKSLVEGTDYSEIVDDLPKRRSESKAAQQQRSMRENRGSLVSNPPQAPKVDIPVNPKPELPPVDVDLGDMA